MLYELLSSAYIDLSRNRTGDTNTLHIIYGGIRNGRRISYDLINTGEMTIGREGKKMSGIDVDFVDSLQLSLDRKSVV